TSVAYLVSLERSSCALLILYLAIYISCAVSFFFLTASATTAIYTLSLHDALPICQGFKAVQGKSEMLPLYQDKKEQVQNRIKNRSKPTKSYRILRQLFYFFATNWNIFYNNRLERHKRF